MKLTTKLVSGGVMLLSNAVILELISIWENRSECRISKKGKPKCGKKKKVNNWLI